MNSDEVILQAESGGTSWKTSYRCCIMRKVISKEVATGGRFHFFLDSALWLETLMAVFCHDLKQNSSKIHMFYFFQHNERNSIVLHKDISDFLDQIRCTKICHAPPWQW